MALLRTRLADDVAPALPPARSRAALLMALRSAVTATERREAALELASIPETVGELAAALGDEPEAHVRAAIVTALVLVGSDGAAAGFAGFLSSEDVELRNLAIDGLREIGTVTEPHVARLLSSADPDVRIFAINTLEVLPCGHLHGHLRRVLEEDTEVNVGLAVVEVLSQVGGPDDVPALRAFAARFADHPFVSFSVDLVCKRAMSGGGE
jgi:hypothetical protein